MKRIKSLRTRILLFVFSAVMLINFIPIYVSANEFDPLDNLLGEVYIQNVATGMYMDIEYGEFYGTPSTENGAYSVQRKYSESDSQKWIIERVQEPSPYAGEIVIRSAYSGKYLGVSYDDTVFLAQYDTIDDFNIWQISSTGDGTYTFSFSFIPTIPDGYTVAVRSPNNSENARIYQMVEEDMVTDECDEWYIVKKVISVVNYYDNSFSAYNNGALIDYIDDAVSFANTVYASNFGIGFYMDGAATYDSNAIASLCNDECNCSSQTHNNHCRGLPKMSDYLYNRSQGREADHIYVMWAHRVPGYSQDYCWINPETGQHETIAALGAVTDNRPVINILYVHNGYANYTPTLQIMAITLFHEITHCLGMNDVYNRGFSAHGSNKYNCIMDEPKIGSDSSDERTISFYNECLDGSRNPFCDDCNLIFSEHVRNYISGNRPISASQ